MLRLPLVARCLLLLSLLPGPLHAAEPLRWAVAANFLPTLQQLVAAWPDPRRQRVVLISGSSGSLYARIRHGAPMDLFLSADRELPARLAAEGLAVPGSLRNYAAGELVLVVRDAGAVDWQAALAQTSDRVALANPRLAPYGRAASQLLQATDLEAPLSPRLVYGDSVQQVLHYLLAGHVQAGFIARAQWLSLKDRAASASWQVYSLPPQAVGDILQTAMIPRHSPHVSEASAFLDFLTGTQGQQLIRQAGYRIPVR